MYLVYHDTIIGNHKTEPKLVFYSQYLIIAYIIAVLKCKKHDHCRIIKR
jgi:hypothetical protein